MPAEFAIGAGVPVYSSCEVDKRVGQPQFRPFKYEPDPPQPCGRAVIEFVVDSAGVPLVSTAREVVSNDKRFTQAMIRELAAARYSPAMRDKRPVAQLATWAQGYQYQPSTLGSIQRAPSKNC